MRQRACLLNWVLVGAVLSSVAACDSKKDAPVVAAVPGVFGPSFPLSLKDDRRQGGGNCNIDFVNDKTVAPAPLTVSGALTVHAWAAVDAQNGIPAQQMVVRLKASDGSEKFALTVPEPREDVAKHFGKDKLREAGFLLKSDVSALKGTYELSVVPYFDGKGYSCNVVQKVVIQ